MNWFLSHIAASTLATTRPQASTKTCQPRMLQSYLPVPIGVSPISCWGAGLTVLLEKTPGNNNIHKMRAVCLLDNNFNYYNNTIFAWHVMISAQSKEQVPIKCFATKGNNCINAVMTKMLLCNESQTHHHPTCIGGNNFGDCYDRVAHPPASIALQNCGIPWEAVWVPFLWCKQCISFFEQDLANHPNHMAEAVKIALLVWDKVTRPLVQISLPVFPKL